MKLFVATTSEPDLVPCNYMGYLNTRLPEVELTAAVDFSTSPLQSLADSKAELIEAEQGKPGAANGRIAHRTGVVRDSLADTLLIQQIFQNLQQVDVSGVVSKRVSRFNQQTNPEL